MRLKNRKNKYGKFKKSTAKKSSFQIVVRKIIFLFLLVLFLGVAGWVFFFSNYTRIQEIEVNASAEDLSQDEIKNKTEIFLKKRKFNFLPRENILNLSGKELEFFLKEDFLKIKEIGVEKKFPHKIILNVQGRENVAIWQRGEEYYLIDGEGLVFKRLSQNEIRENNSLEEFNLIKEEIFSEELSENEKKENLGEIVSFGCQAKERIEQALGVDIKKEMQTPSGVSGEVRLATEDDWSIMFNTQKTVDSQISLLKKLLTNGRITDKEKDRLEYIDLRIPSKAIYKSAIEINNEENEEEKQSSDQEKEQSSSQENEEE
ncbi:MAG: cell division protein FtsQ/DivIB [Patescibacteria group bacterium]